MNKNNLLIEVFVTDTITEVFTSNEETVADLRGVGLEVKIISRF